MNDIVIALQNSGINAVLVDPVAAIQSDTAVWVTNLLSPMVANRVYPLKLPDEPVLPSVVYQPVGRSWIEVDGHRIGTTDRYLLSVRGQTFTGLSSLSNDLPSVIAGFEGQAEITDAAADYEPDQRQYRAHFEVEFTSLATVSQELPAAFVYSVNAEAGENQADNRVSQAVTEGIGVVLVCPSSLLLPTRLTVEQTLIGLQLSAESDVVEYAGGNLLDQSGSVTYWRELFSYRRFIRK